jgi:hypothetical protein
LSRRELLIYVGIAAGILTALLVGAGLGWFGGSSSAGSVPPVRPLSAKATLTPHPILFGDAVTAAIAVHIDPDRVDASSVRVVAAFDPFVPSGAPVVTTSRVGRHETIRYAYTLQCLTQNCVPERRNPLVLTLRPVVVTATAGGQKLNAKAVWPQTAILSRLQRRDIGSIQPHYRRPGNVPAPDYATSPSKLADILTAVAAVLALVGLGVLGWELVRVLERRRRAREVQLTPLEAALAYTREAAGRPDAADRRKALELLATTLDAEGVPALAGAAEDAAWSEEAPTPDRALELADEVEAATGDGA